jgi:hypothetical protein
MSLKLTDNKIMPINWKAYIVSLDLFPTTKKLETLKYGWLTRASEFAI